MGADGGQDNLDFTTAMTDRVTVGRSLTAESGGVIAAYTITTSGETSHAVPVEVRDFLPNWGIEEIGFHPEFEPDEGTITENKVTFRSEVPPDDTLVVKYGVTLSTSEPVEVVARQQSLNPPRVEELGASGDADDAAETAPEPSVDEGDAESLVFGDERETAPADGDATDDRDAAEGTPDTGEAPSADASSAAGEPATDDEPSFDEDASLGDTPSFGGEAAGDGVVAALLGEIERGAVSDAQLAALREALGAGTPTSVDVRLRHVHARMEEFAAYTDALQDLLDGGDPESMDGVSEAVEELRSEVEAVREEQRATAERLDAVEAAVDDLESEMAADIEALRAEVDATAPADGDGPSAEEVEELRNAVNVLARDMEDRFEDLWATIDAVNRGSEAAPDPIN